ncbi:MAG: hypothetical protein KatS3mg005_0027 [Bryobacteraceae bacterium]|nr:MAG: hypothetical protein KatS3mg005_0027 [Bryobacteraceae bacterium]
MQPSAKAEGKSVVEGEADWPRLRRDGGCRKIGEVVFEPLGRSPSGCSRAALFGRGCVRVVSGEGMGTVGMQPSRKREGKPGGEGEGNTVGMQPSAKGSVKKSPGPILAKSEA